MSLEDSQRSERSVTSSLFPELHSLTADRLEQFAELDAEGDASVELLYDSHDESEESSSDSEDDRSSWNVLEESLLPTEVCL